jgi:hypothetical protein
MWPRRGKKSVEEAQKGLESLQVSKENLSPKESSEMELEPLTKNPHREKYRLSPEDVLMLQNEVFKKEDADQEYFESFLKVVRKLVEEKETKRDRKSGLFDSE